MSKLVPSGDEDITRRSVDKSVYTDVALFYRQSPALSPCLYLFPTPRFCSQRIPYPPRWILVSPLRLQSLRLAATSRHLATGPPEPLGRQGHLLEALSEVQRVPVPRAPSEADLIEIKAAWMHPIPMCSTRTSLAFDRGRQARGEHLPPFNRLRLLVEALETDLTRPCWRPTVSMPPSLPPV